MIKYFINLLSSTKLLFLLLLFSISFTANGQQLFIERKFEVDLTKKTLDQIYNFQFDEAENNISILERSIKKHPGVDLLKALLIYWKNLPLEQGTEAYHQYERLMLSTAQQAEEILKKNNQDVEGIFFSMAAYGNLAAFYADEGSTMKAVTNARKAYSSLKKGFDLKEEFAEFYFTTGLYNYYREKYPERKPIYKPFLWFFESGDKKLGLDQIKIASNKALFTKIEAYYYLFHINLRYEKKSSVAVTYTQKLYDLYPKNYLFMSFHAEALFFNKQYKEAEILANKLTNLKMPFYNIVGHVIKGMTIEKQNGNINDAENHYLQALELADKEKFEIDYYKSLSWLGLARIADQNGNKSKARDYVNRSLKLASYDLIVDEAKNLTP